MHYAKNPAKGYTHHFLTLFFDTFVALNLLLNDFAAHFFRLIPPGGTRAQVPTWLNHRICALVHYSTTFARFRVHSLYLFVKKRDIL